MTSDDETALKNQKAWASTKKLVGISETDEAVRVVKGDQEHGTTYCDIIEVDIKKVPISETD